MNCILDNYKDKVYYTFALSKKPRFCIIRDPYERFLSGLKYDLLMHQVDIKDIDIKKVFTSNENHVRNNANGTINHSISQIPYLMNFQIEYYIDISDLNLFLKKCILVKLNTLILFQRNIKHQNTIILKNIWIKKKL